MPAFTRSDSGQEKIDAASEANALLAAFRAQSSHPSTFNAQNTKELGTQDRYSADVATFAAPGPPPRPGLEWKEQTHRWVHPQTGEEHEHTAPVAGHVGRLLSRVKELPAAIIGKATSFVENKYAKLAARYGPTGAKAVLTAMVLLTPVPLPGTSLLPIALAEAVRKIGGLISRGEHLADNAAPGLEDLARQSGMDLGELEREAREGLKEWADSTTDVNRTE